MKKYISRLPQIMCRYFFQPSKTGQGLLGSIRHNSVTKAGLRADNAVFRIGIPQLLAQVGNVHPQVVRVLLMLGAPNFTEQLAVGHHLALMEQKQAQNSVLFGG